MRVWVWGKQKWRGIISPPWKSWRRRIGLTSDRRDMGSETHRGWDGRHLEHSKIGDTSKRIREGCFFTSRWAFSPGNCEGKKRVWELALTVGVTGQFQQLWTTVEEPLLLWKLEISAASMTVKSWAGCCRLEEERTENRAAKTAGRNAFMTDFISSWESRNTSSHVIWLTVVERENVGILMSVWTLRFDLIGIWRDSRKVSEIRWTFEGFRRVRILVWKEFQHHYSDYPKHLYLAEEDPGKKEKKLACLYQDKLKTLYQNTITLSRLKKCHTEQTEGHCHIEQTDWRTV